MLMYLSCFKLIHWLKLNVQNVAADEVSICVSGYVKLRCWYGAVKAARHTVPTDNSLTVIICSFLLKGRNFETKISFSLIRHNFICK